MNDNVNIQKFENVNLYKCKKCGWWVISSIIDDDCDYHKAYGMNYIEEIKRERERK